MAFLELYRRPMARFVRPADWLWKSARPIAQCWIVVAAITYVIDLLHQTRDGWSDGVGRAFGMISSITGPAPFSRFTAARVKCTTLQPSMPFRHR